MLFNPDMDRRMADLHSAVSTGGAITAKWLPAFNHAQSHQPARVVVDIAGSDRRLTFPGEIANSLADQLTINGLGDAANVIRKAVSAN